MKGEALVLRSTYQSFNRWSYVWKEHLSVTNTMEAYIPERTSMTTLDDVEIWYLEVTVGDGSVNNVAGTDTASE